MNMPGYPYRPRLALAGETTTWGFSARTGSSPMHSTLRLFRVGPLPIALADDPRRRCRPPMSASAGPASPPRNANRLAWAVRARLVWYPRRVEQGLGHRSAARTMGRRAGAHGALKRGPCCRTGDAELSWALGRSRGEQCPSCDPHPPRLMRRATGGATRLAAGSRSEAALFAVLGTKYSWAGHRLADGGAACPQRRAQGSPLLSRGCILPRATGRGRARRLAAWVHSASPRSPWCAAQPTRDGQPKNRAPCGPSCPPRSDASGAFAAEESPKCSSPSTPTGSTPTRASSSASSGMAGRWREWTGSARCAGAPKWSSIGTARTLRRCGGPLGERRSSPSRCPEESPKTQPSSSGRTSRGTSDRRSAPRSP